MALVKPPSQIRNGTQPESTGAGPGRLFLIDAMSYIFRAYHALPRLTNRSGLATQAVYGLNNMLRKLMGDYQP